MALCPYNPNHPASKYFGLNDELDRVLAGVLAPVPAAFLVVGGRRIGKTSFLWEIERRLDREQPARAAYVDLGSLPYEPQPAHLFQRIARAVSDKLTGDFGKVGELGEPADESEAFDRLVDFITRLADENSVSRVVIMLDELELLKQRRWVSTVLRNLRAAMTDREKGRRLAFLATASRENLAMELADFGVPVMWFEIAPLRALTEPEFQQLVREPINEPEHRLPLEIENRIWEETGGHPFLTHWIMYHLWQKYQGNLSRSRDEDVSAIIQRFHDESTFFGFLYSSHFGSLERELYRMLMEAPDGLSRREILNRLSVPGREIILSLKVLEQSGVVRREDDRYVCNGQMFKAWFADQVRFLQRSGI